MTHIREGWVLPVCGICVCFPLSSAQTDVFSGRHAKRKTVLKSRISQELWAWNHIKHIVQKLRHHIANIWHVREPSLLKPKCQYNFNLTTVHNTNNTKVKLIGGFKKKVYQVLLLLTLDFKDMYVLYFNCVPIIKESPTLWYPNILEWNISWILRISPVLKLTMGPVGRNNRSLSNYSPWFGSPSVVKILASWFEFDDTPNPGSKKFLDPRSLMVRFVCCMVVWNFHSKIICGVKKRWKKAYFGNSETSLSNVKKQVLP